MLRAHIDLSTEPLRRSRTTRRRSESNKENQLKRRNMDSVIKLQTNPKTLKNINFYKEI